MHDIAVLGGTPAAYAAACRLAKRKCDVVVLAPPPEAIECPLLDWVPRNFFQQPFLPKTFPKRCGAAAFKAACYHNVDLSDTAVYKARTQAGYFLRVEQLGRSLKALAKKAGATVRSTSTEPAIRLEEDSIALLGTTQTRARLLIVAQDRPSEIIGELALPVRTVPHSSLDVVGLDVPLSKSAAKLDLGGALHVLEMPERTELGMFFLHGSALHFRVVSSSAASGTRAAELSSMLRRLQQAQILPESLPLGNGRGATWRPPAGVALEMETHVAKRCLLAGTAGGFVESITGHSLYPTVVSAVLAADVARSALGQKDPQGALMAYKTVWRKSLADYLRPPNTSLHMLLPLLFANKRVVSRFTRALLYGQNI